MRVRLVFFTAGGAAVIGDLVAILVSAIGINKHFDRSTSDSSTGTKDTLLLPL